MIGERRGRVMFSELRLGGYLGTYSMHVLSFDFIRESTLINENGRQLEGHIKKDKPRATSTASIDG